MNHALGRTYSNKMGTSCFRRAFEFAQPCATQSSIRHIADSMSTCPFPRRYCNLNAAIMLTHI